MHPFHEEIGDGHEAQGYDLQLVGVAQAVKAGPDRQVKAGKYEVSVVFHDPTSTDVT